MNFDPGLAIRPTGNPLGFHYGEDVFGPEVENRTLDAIRKSLMEPNCDGPDIVYSIAMNVGKKSHKRLLEELHLLFGVVAYAAGRLGKEPVRSQGHIHKESTYGGGWSTPEVYEIWQGKAVVYMQETADDDPGRCFAVYAEPGDVVIVPPYWAHATISADPSESLVFGAWCDLDYGFEYDKVRAHQGLSWYPLLDETGSLQWKRNENYHLSELIEKKPEKYAQLGLDSGKTIYKQFESDPKRFEFVPKPGVVASVWDGFTP